jgi:hypothetical protein
MAALMTGFMGRQQLRSVLAASLALLIMLPGCATIKSDMIKVTNIDTIIAALIAEPPATVAKVEKILATTLSAAPTQNVFRQYTGQTENIGDGRSIDIEYRMPQSAQATSGPLLIMKIDGPCLTKTQVQKQYGPLTVTGMPRGQSLDEETSFSRHYDWGALSFGFSERNRECVRTIVYSLKK